MAIDMSMPVLVVDDYNTMIRIIRNLLKQIGFQDIDDAVDGSQALGKMRDKHLSAACDDYLERARRHLPIAVVEVADDAELLRRIPASSVVVALEPGGPPAHAQALAGHSDADVALHALTDALLGTIGAGDIGKHFPPSDPQWRGASSDRFLQHAVGLVKEALFVVDGAGERALAVPEEF